MRNLETLLLFKFGITEKQRDFLKNPRKTYKDWIIMTTNPYTTKYLEDIYLHINVLEESLDQFYEEFITESLPSKYAHVERFITLFGLLQEIRTAIVFQKQSKTLH